MSGRVLQHSALNSGIYRHERGRAAGHKDYHPLLAFKENIHAQILKIDGIVFIV